MSKILFILLLIISGCSFHQMSGIQSFYSNCPLPSSNSMVYTKINGGSYVKFTLRNRDIGGCSTDNMARHSAPYWERAELKQTDNLSKNQKHVITFFVKITEGFEGKDETFFQIHNYNASSPNVYPSLMLKWNSFYGGNTNFLQLSILAEGGLHYQDYHFTDYLSIGQFENDWHKVIIEISKIQATRGTVSLSIDGRQLASNLNTYFPSEGTPHIKYGIYRPGNIALPNRQSVIYFSDMILNSTF